MPHYKLLGNQKMMTEENEIFREMSNDFTPSKNFRKKEGIDNLGEAVQNQLNEKNSLKKSSKLKMKKAFNEKGVKGFQYGKLFRETCLV